MSIITPAERQALREKHYNCDPGELDLCNHCKDDYPCEVIKVLDKLDTVSEELDRTQQAWKSALDIAEHLAGSTR